MTNPLTFAPIYYLVYQLGAILTGAVIDGDIKRMVATPPDAVAGWLPRLIDWIQAVGLPLALGYS